MVARASLLIGAFALVAGISRGVDMSPELTAVVHDVLQPYAGTPPPSTSASTKQAADILKNAHFSGSGRPSTKSADLIQKYGKVLALGTRSAQFVPEIVAIHDAIQSGDPTAARQAILDLIKRAGRTAPDEASLKKIVDDLTELEPSKGSLERVTMDDVDRTIDIIWDKGNGRVKIDVLDKKGANGEPVRTTFNGQAKTKSDATGKSVEITGTPDAGKPREVTADKAKNLRDKLNGDWTDQDGNKWVLAGSDSSLTAAKDESGYKVEYKGTYNLAKLNAEHVVTDPRDVSESLPQGVKEQLASQYHPHYKINLDANDAVDRLEGTFIAEHVTYSGLTGEVESVHDPYDRVLVLTRQSNTKTNGLRIVLTDSAFKPLSEVPVYLIPRENVGEGEVWVEVQATRDDKDFDDGRVDSITVRVKSDSNPSGVSVNCIETSANSRIFHSSQAVILEPLTEEITP